MDIQAYLDRIGYTGSRALTLENLTLLIRQHLETVPFENLDCWGKGAPLSNDPEVLAMADTDGDGNITVNDVTTIQRFLAELIHSFH